LSQFIGFLLFKFAINKRNPLGLFQITRLSIIYHILSFVNPGGAAKNPQKRAYFFPSLVQAKFFFKLKQLNKKRLRGRSRRGGRYWFSRFWSTFAVDAVGDFSTAFAYAPGNAEHSQGVIAELVSILAGFGVQFLLFVVAWFTQEHFLFLLRNSCGVR
jgi:hypothetical protein